MSTEYTKGNFDTNVVTLNLKSKIIDSLILMRTVTERTLFVTDAENRLRGVVTEGDLVRAYENNYLPHAQIADIMNGAPIFAIKVLSTEEVVDLFLKFGVLLIPVIDEDGFLLGCQSIRKTLSLI